MHKGINEANKLAIHKLQKHVQQIAAMHLKIYKKKKEIQLNFTIILELKLCYISLIYQLKFQSPVKGLLSGTGAAAGKAEVDLGTLKGLARLLQRKLFLGQPAGGA